MLYKQTPPSPATESGAILVAEGGGCAGGREEEQRGSHVGGHQGTQGASVEKMLVRKKMLVPPSLPQSYAPCLTTEILATRSHACMHGWSGGSRAGIPDQVPD